MHVLVFAPFGVAEYHFDTDLEIAQRHLEQGDRVTIATCNAELLTCEVNVEHDLGRCLRCIGRHLEGVTRLSPKPEVVSLLRLSATDREEIRRIDFDALKTNDDLRGLQIDNFDVGWAVLSSLISHLQGGTFDIEAQRPRVKAGILSAMAVYRSMQNLIRDLKVDRVYAFNGRFATMRAVLRAAQGLGVDCHIHERGSTFEKFSLFENHLPHEIDFYQGLIRDAWDKADPEVREAIGSGFYADRLTGSLGSWVSFSGNQQSGMLPEDWKERPNNVAVFTTSSDETDALADVLIGKVYKDQYEALDRIFQSIPSDSQAHFYVRIHPRTQHFPDPGAQRLQTLRLPNVSIISGASPVNTYALMRRASRVLTFGSTTGIEAAFWGVPSILGSRSFYDHLGSTHNPRTHEEMVRLLVDDLPPNDRVGALMYGHFEKTLGIRFRHFRPLGLFGGSFKDSPIKPNLILRTAGWLHEHAVARDARNRVHLKLSERRLLS